VVVVVVVSFGVVVDVVFEVVIDDGTDVDVVVDVVVDVLQDASIMAARIKKLKDNQITLFFTLRLHFD